MKYKPNNKAGKLVKINSYQQGGTVSVADKEADDRYVKWSTKNQEETNEKDAARYGIRPSLPIIVNINGRPSPSETGRLIGKNFNDAADEKFNSPSSARARAEQSKAKE